MTGSAPRVSRLIGAAAFSLVLGAAVPAQAQQLPVTALDLPVGRSLPLRTEANVSKVSVADPTVADVVVISESEVVINSLKPGETDAILWLANGTRTHYRIGVHSPADRMQIAIMVKFAEVRRSALRNLGLSGFWTDGHTRVGSGIFNTDNNVGDDGKLHLPTTSKFVTVLSDLGTDKVLAFLDAEETKGNAKLLAEPNIMAGNKDSASFLAGGELPIPVVQGGAGGSNGSPVTIQYREFGIRLTFFGEIVSDSLIRLYVKPEVSSLDYANSITLQGFRIPALRTRRIASTLDVRRSQSLILSGMFSGEEEKTRTGLPLLKDIPILGELFSSTQFQRNESELLIVVTPVVVDPMHPRALDLLDLKADTTRPAIDALKKRLPEPKKP